MKSVLLIFGLLFCLSSSEGAPAAPTPANAQPVPEYTLRKCLEIALVNNPRIRQASTQFTQAKGQGILLHAILYPTVNAQALSTPFVIYVQINQVFYSRATFPQLRLSRLTQEQAFINYRQILCDVVFQLRQAFTTALAAEDRADLIWKFNEQKAREIDPTQKLFDAGKVDKSVVFNVQVQANLSKQSLATAELNMTQAKIVLQNLLGQEIPEKFRLVGELNDNAPTNLDTGKLIGQALAEREDLKLLESLKLSEEQQIQIDTKNIYPIVGASSNSATQPPQVAFASSFNAEANYNEPSTVRTSGNTQLPLSLYVTWTLFDGGNVRGVKMSDQAVLATQQVAINALKQSITGEVGGAVAQLIRGRDRIGEIDKQPKPEELRKMAEQEYDAGQIRQLDKVNLENAIFEQELLRLQSQYDIGLAAAALDHALGHGLKTSFSKLPPQDH